jgi:hypothetical protein
MTTEKAPRKQPHHHAHTGTPGLVCPHCGHPQEEPPDMDDGPKGHRRCEACREAFTWSAAVTVKFSTARK